MVYKNHVTQNGFSSSHGTSLGWESRALTTPWSRPLARVWSGLRCPSCRVSIFPNHSSNDTWDTSLKKSICIVHSSISPNKTLTRIDFQGCVVSHNNTQCSFAIKWRLYDWKRKKEKNPLRDIDIWMTSMLIFFYRLLFQHCVSNLKYD